jgi:hypothetical protein
MRSGVEDHGVNDVVIFPALGDERFILPKKKA